MEMVTRWRVVLLDVWMGLSGAWTSPWVGLPPSPSPTRVTSRPKELAAVLPAQNLSSFPNNLPLFPATFWQLGGGGGGAFLLTFNLPNACSHRGDPNPAEYPGMQSICSESQLLRCQQGLFQTWKGGWGWSVEAAALLSKAGPGGKRSGSTGWLEKRAGLRKDNKQRKGAWGPLLCSFPTCFMWSHQLF